MGAEKEWKVDEQVWKLEQEGLIEQSSSAWFSAVVMVKKRMVHGDFALTIGV